MTDYRERERKAIGDAQYEAWRRGYNPDHVDDLLVIDDVYRGYDSDECAERAVKRLHPRKRSGEEEDPKP